jgi:polar amino acid transport system substrate-binding protein
MASIRATVAAAVLATVAVGCGSSPSSTATTAAVSVPTVLPAGAQAVQTGGASGTAATDNCNNGLGAKASLSPLTPLPAPGHMPTGSYMATIAARGYLVAGVDQNTYLWAYRDPTSGTLAGFDIDMIRQVAQAIFGDPTRVRFVIVANAARIAAVQQGPANGGVDIVAETMTITCTREQSVDFSTEYYAAGQRILVPSGSTIRGASDLAGRKVCAPAGSTSITNLQRLAHPPTIWAGVNQTDCLVMLQQGDVDAVSTDDTILQGLAAQDPQTHLVGATLSDEPYGMAINKAHPEFTRFVNAVLAAERANGTWTHIWTTWLAGVEKTAPPKPPVALYTTPSP